MTSPAELHEHLRETSPGKLLLHMPSMPVPNIKMDISVATYITLLNGQQKCQQTFWWRFMDPYAKRILQDAAITSGISASSGHVAIANGNAQLGQASASVEEWTAPHDNNWRKIMYKRLKVFRDKYLKDGPQNEIVATMNQVHLGCFWAVSHLLGAYEALFARTSDFIATTRHRLQEISPSARVPIPPPSPEQAEAELVAHSLQVASRAFNAVQLDICTRIAQNIKTGSDLAQEWKLFEGDGRRMYTDETSNVPYEEPEELEGREEHTRNGIDHKSFTIQVLLITNRRKKHMTTLVVESSDTIEEVKSKIQVKAGICVQGLYLTLDGKRLVEDFTLSYYNIQEASTLLLMNLDYKDFLQRRWRLLM